VRLDGDDLRRLPLPERKTKLRKLLRRSAAGIQYVEHAEGDGDEMYEAARKLGLEGIVSKRLTAPYKSGPWCGIRTRPRTCGSSIARSSRTRVSGIARNRPSHCSIEPHAFRRFTLRDHADPLCAPCRVAWPRSGGEDTPNSPALPADRQLDVLNMVARKRRVYVVEAEKAGELQYWAAAAAPEDAARGLRIGFSALNTVTSSMFLPNACAGSSL
jgi:ATP dependent DNA ligase domain